MFNDFEIPEEMTIDEMLKFAEGKSVLNSKTEREGLVFKNSGTKSASFKVNSNNYLTINSFKAIGNNHLMKVG